QMIPSRSGSGPAALAFVGTGQTRQGTRTFRIVGPQEKPAICPGCCTEVSCLFMESRQLQKGWSGESGIGKLSTKPVQDLLSRVRAGRSQKGARSLLDRSINR